jgi:alpha-beta hydrolase superfamily lysophospholipase
LALKGPGEKGMVEEEKLIKLSDGLELFIRVQEKSLPVWMIAVHGIGEHSGRHSWLYDTFSQDYNLLRFDLRGHGKSAGPRAQLESFDQFRQDLTEVIEYVTGHYGSKRYVLFGHSMGGFIVSDFIQSQFRGTLPYPEKVFLSSPVVSLPGLLGKTFMLMPFGMTKGLSKLSLGLYLKGMVDLNELSHDLTIAERYTSDPLTQGQLHTTLLFNLIDRLKKVFSRPLNCKCPLYVAVGGQDKIVDVGALKFYFEVLEKQAKVLVIDGAKHELHNEIKKYRDPYIEFLRTSMVDEDEVAVHKETLASPEN